MNRSFLSIVAALLLLGLTCPGADAAGTNWPPVPDADGFEPDLHPSAEAMYRTAGRQAARAVAKVWHGPDGADEASSAPDLPKTIVIFCGGAEDAADAIALAIRQELPDVQVSHVCGAMPSPGRPPADEVWVRFQAAGQGTARVGWSREPIANGVVSLLVAGRNGNESLSLKYAQKPWVVDFASFQQEDPKGQWLKAEADRAGTSPNDAARLATAAAAKALAGRARERFFPRGGGVSDDRLYRYALSRMSSERWVADRFSTRFHRDYGDVWHEAVLLDASDQALAALVNGASGAQQVERRDTMKRFASGLAMVAVVIVLYWLVNALTKGYFVWRLRAVATVMIVAVLVLGMMLLRAGVG